MPPYTMYIYGIMVSTLASDADDPGSNPGRVHYYFFSWPLNIFYIFKFLEAQFIYISIFFIQLEISFLNMVRMKINPLKISKNC